MSAYEELHQIEQQLDILASKLRRVAPLPTEARSNADIAIDRIDGARDRLKDAMAIAREFTGASDR